MTWFELARVPGVLERRLRLGVRLRHEKTIDVYHLNLEKHIL